MPLLSVIVPVYKVEAYLDECVESILNQTYTDLELILVDDGSPDRSGEMCDAWAERDSRVRVIHTPTAASARPGTPVWMRPGANMLPLSTATTGWTPECMRPCWRRTVTSFCVTA